MIHVDILKPTKKELKPFIQLPFDIYKEDSNWVPPKRHDLLKSLMGRDNELFAQGIQRFFLVYDHEKPVARVLAGIALRQHGKEGTPYGYISLFDSYDNDDYARSALDAAIGFLKDHGVKEVVGPIPPAMTSCPSASWWMALTGSGDGKSIQPALSAPDAGALRLQKGQGLSGLRHPD